MSGLTEMLTDGEAEQRNYMNKQVNNSSRWIENQCPQCEASDDDFYNGFAIGDTCDDCKEFNRAVDEALIETGGEFPILVEVK
jgi:hypothetical protein